MNLETFEAMGKFDSKRVLHLGRGGLTSQNIEYLNGNGAYMIVADKCPKEKNPYRGRVDEVAELDIDDTSAVIRYCKANHIDAVFANGAEDSYEQTRIINEGIGNAFCHTAEQWQTFVKKDNFRKLCIEFGLDVPKTYYSGKFTDITEEIEQAVFFPAIVKPVDNAGGIGISFVSDPSELDAAIQYAGENSPSSRIIVEEYVVGRETVFTYMVQDGIYKLTATADKYVYKNEKNLTATPDLYIYPSDRHELYVKSTNEKVLSMLKNQGLNNCTIFFQTIEKDGKFYFFESGLRFEGTRTCLITKRFTGQNALHFYYDYVLKTKTDYDIAKDDPELNGHTLAMFVIHLKKGRIRQIRGQDKIFNNDKVLRITYLRHIGETAGEEQIDRCFAAFCMEGSDKEELVKQIRFIKKTLSVRGYFHRNLIVDSFDENILLGKKSI